MNQKKKIPVRIYVCQYCPYQTEYRYVLRNHLRNVHKLSKRESADEAADNEYWLNPHYVRAGTYDDEE